MSAAIDAVERIVRAIRVSAGDALHRTAIGAVDTDIERLVPKAFGELAGSGHVEPHWPTGAAAVYDAPHAAAVEQGAKPHWVPLAPLVAWVRLRGMQALGPKSSHRPADRGAIRGVGASLHALTYKHEGMGRASPADAAEQVARAIQHALATRGTKPRHFALGALPSISRRALRELRRSARNLT
jgi:hypothetical protein